MTAIESQILELFRQLTPKEKAAFASLMQSLQPQEGAPEGRAHT